MSIKMEYYLEAIALENKKKEITDILEKMQNKDAFELSCKGKESAEKNH